MSEKAATVPVTEVAHADRSGRTGRPVMLLRQLAAAVEPLAYRLAGLLLASMLDDPAMLALAFC